MVELKNKDDKSWLFIKKNDSDILVSDILKKKSVFSNGTLENLKKKKKKMKISRQKKNFIVFLRNKKNAASGPI